MPSLICIVRFTCLHTLLCIVPWCYVLYKTGHVHLLSLKKTSFRKGEREIILLAGVLTIENRTNINNYYTIIYYYELFINYIIVVINFIFNNIKWWYEFIWIIHFHCLH